MEDPEPAKACRKSEVQYYVQQDDTWTILRRNSHIVQTGCTFMEPSNVSHVMTLEGPFYSLHLRNTFAEIFTKELAHGVVSLYICRIRFSVCKKFCISLYFL